MHDPTPLLLHLLLFPFLPPNQTMLFISIVPKHLNTLTTLWKTFTKRLEDMSKHGGVLVVNLLVVLWCHCSTWPCFQYIDTYIYSLFLVLCLACGAPLFFDLPIQTAHATVLCQLINTIWCITHSSNFLLIGFHNIIYFKKLISPQGKIIHKSLLLVGW